MGKVPLSADASTDQLASMAWWRHRNPFPNSVTKAAAVAAKRHTICGGLDNE